MVTTAASYRTRQFSAPTLVDTVDNRIVETFGHDFIERRLRQHREWQQGKAAADASAIISEVAAAFDLADELRAGKGPRKIARLK